MCFKQLILHVLSRFVATPFYPINLDNSGFADLIPGRQAGLQSALAAFFMIAF
jgi:hypothetical protein